MELNQMLTWALAEATPSGDANMDMILKKVLKYRALEEASIGISDMLSSGENQQDLENMNLKLEILQKKKQLGMDYDTSQEFEDGINGADDAVKGTLSNRFANLSDKRSKRFGVSKRDNPQSLQALYKEAHAISPDSPSAGLDRRAPHPYFKTAEKVVTSQKEAHTGFDLFKKFLGGTGTNGPSRSLWRSIIRR